MAKKSLNMIEKMMDPNIIDYYIINCAIPSIITIENRYQIDFGGPGVGYTSNVTSRCCFTKMYRPNKLTTSHINCFQVFLFKLQISYA